MITFMSLMIKLFSKLIFIILIMTVKIAHFCISWNRINKTIIL